MDQLVGILTAGGPIVLVLLVLSVCSLALIGAKLFQFRGTLAGEPTRENAYEMWAKGDKTAAIHMLETGTTPTDRIALAAMKGTEAARGRKVLEAELEWRGNYEVARMQQHISLLELVAMISPLLGLLGTVLGMIQSFQELALAEGAANASLLAAGIWQALLTTAAGLLVAIPAAVAAALLNGRVERVAQQIEANVGRLFSTEDSRL